MNNPKLFKKSLLCTSVLLALSAQSAMLSATEYGANNNNFTFSGATGQNYGAGSNLVKVTWDGTLNTDVATAVSNMTISLPSQQILDIIAGTLIAGTLDFHDVKVFGPGTYVFEACPAPIDGGTSTAADGSTNCTVSAPVTMTVGPDQIGAHMLVDSGSGDLTGINGDLINVWNKNATWGFSPNGPASGSRLQGFNTGCWTGKGPVLTTPECDEFYATEWFLTSADADGNAAAGMNMVDGPFMGFSGAFNIQKIATTNDALIAVKNAEIQTSVLMDNDNLPANITAGVFAITADVMSEQGGTVTNNNDGTFAYLPPVNFTGFDSFTYQVDDGVDHTDAITLAALRPALGAEGHYKTSAKVDIVVLAENLVPGVASQPFLSNSEPDAGSSGVLSLALALMLLPLRLFSRRK